MSGSRALGRNWAIAAIVAIIVAGLIVTGSAGWTSAELAVLQTVSDAHTPALDGVAVALDWLFAPGVAVVILLIGALAVLLRTRSLRSTTQFIVLVVLPWFGSDIIKIIVHRTRPDIDALSHVIVAHRGGFSYPSGHTSFASCLAITAIILAQEWRWKPAVVVVALTVALATGLSRVYLGVHYPTDVIASFLYAACAVTLANTLWQRKVVPRWPDRRLW